MKQKNKWRAKEVPNNIMTTYKHTNDSANKMLYIKYKMTL